MMTPEDLSKKMFLSNVKALELIPYTDKTATTLGQKLFSFDAILADSVALNQDDPTTNQRDSETKDEPILQNTVLGAYQFAATSLDMQATILQNFIGWVAGGSSDTDVYYAPSAYEPKYALCVIKFSTTDNCIVIPKLKLNSKLTLASLKTSSGQIDLAGTAYAGKLQIGGGAVETPVALVPTEKLSTVINGYSAE